MKRRIVLFLLMSFLLTVPSFASDTISVQYLTECSPEECVSELEGAGISIRKVYDDESVQAAAVKTIIRDLNDCIILGEITPYNYTELSELALELRQQVLEKDKKYAMKYTLANSTVIGKWKNEYANYNCYGYSINRKKFVNPGYYSGKAFSMSYSISKMADITISDLEKLGYTAYKKAGKPTKLNDGERIICIRKGPIDYHFMKGGSSVTKWEHKPGGTNPLKWKYSNPGKKVWTNEYSIRNVCYSGNTKYNSTIFYIVYKPKNYGPKVISKEAL